MRIIQSKEEWVRYMRELNDTGIAGAPYEFQHIESPEFYPCGVQSIVDDHPPAGASIALVHMFFTEDDARQLLGLGLVTMEDDDGSE